MIDPTFFRIIDTPVDKLLLAARNSGLTVVYFEPHEAAITAAWHPDDGNNGDASIILESARAQLEAYFSGDLTTFDLPLAPEGTVFQQRVWELLREIPFGESTSYGELARRIGGPNSARAVGSANGRNPLPIIVPCHRVIGADGSLTGFGGGMHRKQWLLEHERAVLRHRGQLHYSLL